jgi:hypothetical protein
LKAFATRVYDPAKEAGLSRVAVSETINSTRPKIEVAIIIAVALERIRQRNGPCCVELDHLFRIWDIDHPGVQSLSMVYENGLTTNTKVSLAG